MQMNSSSLRTFSCSVLLNSRLIWNSLNNLYSSYFKHLKRNFYKMLCLSTIHNQRRQKTFANEHMTTTKSKTRKSHPYGFLYVHFCIGNCSGTRVLEKFSSPLQLLTDLPVSCPCPFSSAGLAVSVATF